MPLVNQLTAIKPQDGTVLPLGELMERIIAAGDVSQLSPGDRAHYLVRVAESAGLNPLTQPFDLIPGPGGKLVLYANKRATDQLRKIYGLTSRIVSKQDVDGVYVVDVEVGDGVRAETNIGAVPIAGLKGEALANALMKTITKAKRRATLDFCGLGVLDETEVESMRAAIAQERPAVRVVEPAPAQPQPALGDGIPVAEVVNQETGEITERPVTKEDLGEQIKRLREQLGWTVDDVRTFAAGQYPPISLRNVEGLAAVAALLESQVQAEEERRQEAAGQRPIDAGIFAIADTPEPTRTGEPGNDPYTG